LVWGRPPSDAETQAFFAARTTQSEGLYWQDCSPSHRIEKSGGKDLGLIEFCARYDSVELWIDPEPNAQLNLVWLLDYLRAYEQLASKVKFIQTDFRIGDCGPEKLSKSQPPLASVTAAHLEAAGVVWRAYRAPTPQAWSTCLGPI
jgi:hypothetical protein